IYLLTGEIPKNKYSWHSNLPNISPEFANILDKSIEEKLSDRYQSAKEMLTAIKSSKTSYSRPKTKLQITKTPSSLQPTQKISPVILTNPKKNQWLKIGIVTIIVGIISIGTYIFYNNKNQTQSTLDAATEKAEKAITKAKKATEKNELEIARNQLEIAIKELDNIPQNQEINNQIQAKKSEYLKTINKINLALKKQPCYEQLWQDNCQQYPIKLDNSSFD
ncbi:MAG: serine/threonine protein kinase, partial [Trichodesmium sp. St5_bin8]|nr:serine/threonine protein kinase [Trichodesmium sp. St5_bin8]